MKLNLFTKRFSTVVRFMATTLFCVLACAFVWQGAFLSNTAAMASPATTLIATADAGDQVKGAADDVARKSKEIIRGSEAKVKETASKNAAKVDAADDEGTVVEGKAKRDRDRIYSKASKDAARTEKAVDKSKNAVEEVVDSIKDAFSK